MAVFAVVSSLQNHCLRAVAGQLPNHETSLSQLPVEIKTKLVNLLSKRGLLTDANLGNVSNTLSLDLEEENVDWDFAQTLAEKVGFED